jgi:predicted  nucleic acid-binding Zn-ribbon protein
MVIKALWQNLKDLVDFDKKVFKLTSEIDSTKKAADQDTNQIPKLRALLEDKKLVWTHLQKNIDSLELDAKLFEEEEKSKKEKLDHIKNQKEYSALETEMGHARNKRIKIENQITEYWYQLEQAKNEYESERDKLVQKEELFTKDLLTKQEHIKDLTQQIDVLNEERKTFSDKIPADWLTKYERMKHSVDDPIVPVVNGSCSACYYTVLYQDLLKLKKSGVLPCRNCYRFLYYDEEEEKSLLQAKY